MNKITTAPRSMRQEYIKTIMNGKYKDNDSKYDDQNLAFLESLSLKELAHLASSEETEDLDEDDL